jgi:hypothetical protein
MDRFADFAKAKETELRARANIEFFRKSILRYN